MSPISNVLADDAAWFRQFYDEQTPRGPSTTYQGLLVEPIVVDERAVAAADPAVLLDANIAYVDWMFNIGGLLAGEFALESLWSYAADAYLHFVLTKGHASWVDRATPVLHRACESGLAAFAPADYLHCLRFCDETLREWSQRTRGLPPREREAALPQLDAQLAKIDAHMHKLDRSDPLRGHNGAWLRRRPQLRGVAANRLEQEWNSLVRHNALRTARLAEKAGARTVPSEQVEPTRRAIEALCRRVGLKVEHLTAGVGSMTPAAPGEPQYRGLCWGVRTDRGVHHVFFFDQGLRAHERFRAALYQQRTTHPLAAMTLSAADYAQIIPKDLPEISIPAR
jgi:hypothetical protein